jgi:hypothetical protein
MKFDENNPNIKMITIFYFSSNFMQGIIVNDIYPEFGGVHGRKIYQYAESEVSVV